MDRKLAISGWLVAATLTGAPVCAFQYGNSGSNPVKNPESGSSSSGSGPSAPAASAPSTPAPSSPAAASPRTPSGPAMPAGTPWTPPTPAPSPKAPPLMPLDPHSPVADARMDFASWHAWWRFNGEAYLDLGARLSELDRRTAGDDFSLGSGEKAQRGELGSRAVIDEVAPALWTMVQEGRENARTRAALLALGRIQSSWYLPAGFGVEATAPALLGSRNAEAAEAMIVSLGLSGTGEAVDVLVDVLGDTEAARALCKLESIDYRKRALAAYGLALAARGDLPDAGREKIVGALSAALRNPNAPYDLQLAAAIAYGLVPLAEHPGDDALGEGAHVCRAVQVEQLIELATDPRRHAWVRAQARIPLARLAAGATGSLRTRALELLVEPLESKTTVAPELLQATAIALGLIADCDQDELDVEARSALQRISSRGDRLARGLALIALGKVAARRGPNGESQAAQASIREQLQMQLTRGSDDRRAWAALALGVLGHDAAQSGQDVPAEIAPALRAALGGSRSPDDAAAACLALAVLRDPQAGEPVLELFQKTREEHLRGYAALALGCVGASEASDPLAALFASGPRQGAMFHHAATAMRLLSQPAVVPGLIEHAQNELARKGADQSGLIACASTLGRIGDPRAVALLAKIARTNGEKDGARGAAAVALADLCDKEPQHWTSRISTDLHFGLLASTLLSYTGNGTGLLEMR
jgi:hypothetical protein